MATEIIMPVLGMTMESGIIVEWMKQEGDSVVEGDVLFNVETDKSVMEVEAKASGTILKIIHGAGDEVPIQKIIGYIGNEGESLADDEVNGTSLTTSLADEIPPKPEVPKEVGTALAEEHPSRVKISPKARKHARDLSLAIENIVGTGPGGRIVFSDVETYAVQTRKTPTPTELPILTEPGSKREESRTPLSGLRKVVATRLTQSASTTPHFYLTMEIDMTRITGLREQLLTYSEKRGMARVSVNDLIIKAAGITLRSFPAVNTSLDGNDIVQFIDVNVGFAVALDDGLVVPVVGSADQKSVFEIAAITRALSDKARGPGLGPEDYGYGTFTISNLGMYGVDQFTAIINPPEAAILAVGRIKEIPVAVDGKVEIRPIMSTSLSSDHRLIDGAVAGQFLAYFRDVLEQPLELLIGQNDL